MEFMLISPLPFLLLLLPPAATLLPTRASFRVHGKVGHPYQHWFSAGSTLFSHFIHQKKRDGGVWGEDDSISKPLHSIIHRDMELKGAGGGRDGVKGGAHSVCVLDFLC